MNRVPDRKKQRRDYLDRKADAYARAIEGGLWIAAALFFLAHIPQITYAGFGVWEDRFVDRFGATGNHDETWRSFVAVSLPTATLAATAIGLICVRGIRLINQARKATNIPYAPPVKASILPAEEILVRGAAEPSAPNETLLRATQEGEEAKEQLLRSGEYR